MKKILTLVAVWALAAVASAAPAAKRVIVVFKSGTTAAGRLKALQDMGGREVSSIISNGNTRKEFVAVVAEVPAKPSGFINGLRSAMGLSPAPVGGDVLSVEDDF